MTQLRFLFPLALLVGAACADEPAPAFTTDGQGPEVTENVGRVVATLKTQEGAVLRFIDDSAPGDEPSIGVEIGNTFITPVTDAVLAQEPTALELYQALAPGQQAPAALRADHERTALALGRDVAPRQLSTFSLDSETFGYYDCANTVQWTNDFTGWAPVLDGQYIATNEQGVTTGYVGYAPKFYFDVCRPWTVSASDANYWVRVQRRASSASAWATVNANPDALSWQQRRWRYYRNTFTCSSYQYRLYVSSPAPNKYHRAARWADEWSCQIGS